MVLRVWCGLGDVETLSALDFLKNCFKQIIGSYAKDGGQTFSFSKAGKKTKRGLKLQLMMFRLDQARVLVLLRRVTDDVKSHLPSSKYPAVSMCLFSAHFLSSSFFFFLIFIYLAALGDSCGRWDPVPQTGIELGPPALGAQSLSHWTPQRSPSGHIFTLMLLLCSDSCPGGFVSWCLRLTPWLIFKGQESLGQSHTAGHEQMQCFEPRVHSHTWPSWPQDSDREHDRFRFPNEAQLDCRMERMRKFNLQSLKEQIQAVKPQSLFCLTFPMETTLTNGTVLEWSTNNQRSERSLRSIFRVR